MQRSHKGIIECQLEDKACAVLRKNRKTRTKQGVDYQFTCPSTTLYHWQWLWDSCFHAIALMWNEPEAAKMEIMSLLSGQWADGRIPNMVHIGWNWRCDRIVHGTGRDTSGITQPPIIATAVMKVFEVTGDRDFLKTTYEPMKRYYKWLETARETDGDGLIAVYHPWESGIDNSPRWDAIFEIENFSRKKFDITKGLVMFRFNFVRYKNDRMKAVSPFFVKGIDMNCYYHANLMTMARIARLLGHDSDADEFESRASRTRAAVQSRMWDPQRQVFGDLIDEGQRERFSHVPTPFSFLPMWSGIADQQQARLIHGEITDPAKFWTEYAVPTTALDYPKFDENGYWRGTTWINTNWLTIEGLLKYGFTETAETLKEKTLKLVDRGGFFEYYNPLTGKGLGTEDFGWSTLVIDLVNRNLSDEAARSE